MYNVIGIFFNSNFNLVFSFYDIRPDDDPRDQNIHVKMLNISLLEIF